METVAWFAAAAVVLIVLALIYVISTVDKEDLFDYNEETDYSLIDQETNDD